MDDFALFLSVLGAILGIIWFAVVYLRIKDIRDDIRMIRLLMQGNRPAEPSYAEG